MKNSQNFIDFALSLYAQPAVEAECLGLQERHQLSIPLLLYCAWLEHRAVGASLAAIRAQSKPVLDWEQAVVWPLRRLRQQLKPEAALDTAVAALRTTIKEAELAAEMEILKRLGLLTWNTSTESALTSVSRFYELPRECDSFSALRARMAELKADTLTGQTN